MEARLEPHHDGSPAYVPAAGRPVIRPVLGERVPVRVEVPHDAGVDTVHVRSTPDGEPTHTAAARVHRGAALDVWEGYVEVVNPTTRYRFVLDGGAGTRWLTQIGVLDHDVPDTWDFALVTAPAPDWVADATLYQVFPDRFDRAGVCDDWPAWAEPAAWDDPVATAHPASMRQLYGGDLPGITARLDHLEDLGVTGAYLTPVFPAPENHRYCASSFDHVDPMLGGDDALAELAAALHARGMRLLGDLTLNHSGDQHPWFRAAVADPTSVEAGFYAWKDEPGGAYHSWVGVPSLPKFDHRDPELRRRLYDGPDSVAARWLRAPVHLDGWRVDAANMAGRCGEVDVSHDLQRRLRATVEAAGEDAYLLAEHAHDATAVLQGGGWHGTMDYTGFTRSAWSWLRGEDVEVELLGLPVPVPRRSGQAAVHALRLVRGQLPWCSVLASMSLLDSHDTARWAYVAADRGRRHVGLAWLLTSPGVPSLYYGTELGLAAPDSELGRLPMPWDDRPCWDEATLVWTRRLVHLRRDSVGLRRGGQRWLHAADDAVVFLREHPEERVLVQLTRDGCEPVELDAAVLGIDRGAAALDHGDLTAHDERVVVPGTDGAAARVWRLPPRPWRWTRPNP